MTPALLMSTSMLGREASERIVDAADRMDDREVRLREMNLAVVVGEIVWICSITGWILDGERPRRMIVEGWPAARQRAVSAPTLPVLGPVMRKVRPLTLEGKSDTIVEPSVVKL